MATTKYRIYMTKKHQNWTFGEKEGLYPYLDGEDDEIFEFAVFDKNFAIILKNGLTYEVADTEEEARNFISHTYRNYAIEQNEGPECYISREDTNVRYKSSAEAMAAGLFDYVYVPVGSYYLAKFGKIIGTAKTIEEIYTKMYQHYRAKYTYMYG